MTSTVNLSGYKFVAVADPELERAALHAAVAETHLKGTIFLSPEGINFMLAGSRQDIDAFRELLDRHPLFSGVFFKESFSETVPFQRLLFKLKKELVPLGDPDCKPHEKPARLCRLKL